MPGTGSRAGSRALTESVRGLLGCERGRTTERREPWRCLRSGAAGRSQVTPSPPWWQSPGCPAQRLLALPSSVPLTLPGSPRATLPGHSGPACLEVDHEGAAEPAGRAGLAIRTRAEELPERAERVLCCPGRRPPGPPAQAPLESAVSGPGKAPGSHTTCWPPGDPLSFPFTAANPLLCSTARYHCKNGLCIDKSFICDGQNNCQDNSDEEGCESSQGRAAPAAPLGEEGPLPGPWARGRVHLLLSWERPPPRFL